MSRASAPALEHEESILVVDFGAQYAQLIARRLRELHVYCEIHPAPRAYEAAQRLRPRGVILSGGPASVYAANAPVLDRRILDLGVPFLGICYGMQWLCESLGGKVEPADVHEYGRASMVSERQDALLAGVSSPTQIWMSHGDRVVRLPEGAVALGTTESCPLAAMAIPARKLYGVQFHPEVTHTVEGKTLLANFVRHVCGCAGTWRMGSFVDLEIERLRQQIGETGEVILGLSGGVDSSVVACLLQRAIGERLHCIFVDNGLLRAGERESVEEVFRGHFQMDLTVVDARERFLSKLDGVDDPEKKRKIIGYEFVEVFRAEAKRFKNARFLGQGTLYPDVIESVAVHGGPTATIKSHHNVGGLPKDLELELVEPLRELFKDEVRELGVILGLPEEMVRRQPFPGPGLAVRVPGAIQRSHLEALRAADKIVRQEIEAAGWQKHLWQYFAVFLPVRSVGVMGDGRTYEHAVAVRLVESEDAMTADWALPPKPILDRISNRIINEVDGINRVVLDISSKPPATIEWE
ncbi:MAG: glutamine-hydrolyzing GMP synthase [Planctomycetes bacterium]|nr:glutamine-hydrolyzing GMP synthase [Planctomycetota bacterium]